MEGSEGTKEEVEAKTIVEERRRRWCRGDGGRMEAEKEGEKR